MTISNVMLFAAAICVGLMSGLFYSYSCSVTLALNMLPDAQYISAMQSINKAIQNPLFFTVFFGALILLPVSAYLKYSHPVTVSFWLLLAAAFIYIVGSFGVTAFGNIPLNNALEKFNLAAASKEEITLQRSLFEARWNTLNIIRTIASLLSFILVIAACFNNSDGTP